MWASCTCCIPTFRFENIKDCVFKTELMWYRNYELIFLIMKINVGSTNQAKIEAVTEVVGDYPMFKNAEVVGVEVTVELFGHPKSLAETVNGAIERAKKAFVDCDYSVGIEGGLMAVPHTTTGYIEIGVCAVYDGTRHALGFSSGMEWPTKVTELILAGYDGSQALRETGLTAHTKVGTAGGGSGILTEGRMDRKATMKQGLIMALIQFEHPELYPCK